MEIIPPSRRRQGFTLMELLVVMGIITVLLIALVPAVNSISKSSGRKAAINNLVGAIEQARVLAIKDAQSTYVVFPDQLPGSPSPVDVERYCYRSFAIFEDDPANTGSIKQITPWRSLPTGISLRRASLGSLAKTTTFSFSPMGAGKTGNFPFLKFTSSGEVDPSSTPSSTTGTVQFDVFEGFVDPAAGDKDTNSSKPTETVAVNRLTGRAGRAVPTANPTP